MLGHQILLLPQAAECQVVTSCLLLQLGSFPTLSFLRQTIELLGASVPPFIFFFLCPCFSVAMHVSCPCDCAQHSSLSEPTCCRLQMLQTKPIAMEKEDLLYFSLFTLCPVPALPGLLHESLSCVKAWSSRSFRSCLHVPFFINPRAILAPALEQAHLPLGIHLLFHEQLLLVSSSFRNTYT